MDFKSLLLIAILGCYFCAVTHVSGDCYFSFPKNDSNRPVLYKKIGSRKTLIHTDGLSRYDINDGEVITIDCETRILSPIEGEGLRSFDLNCTDSRMPVFGYPVSNIKVWCDSVKWNLYETSEHFDWCPPPMSSYLLARPLDNVYEYLAGVCYNFEQQQIQSLYYAAGYQFSKYKHPSRLENYSPLVEIKDIPKKFIPRRIDASQFSDEETRKFMQFSKYENHAVIQDPQLYKDYFDRFGGLLEMDWWPSLRLGNWYFYEKALRQHIEDDKAIYDILVGVSGAVTVPSQNKIHPKNYTMIDMFYGYNQRVPLYMWHYLKSPRENGKDLVVIGVNSAFIDFYNDENDLIFCTDICHQIDWLKMVRSTFHYITMGLVFCCDVNEVRRSNHLEGFPLASE